MFLHAHCDHILHIFYVFEAGAITGTVSKHHKMIHLSLHSHDKWKGKSQKY